jgi:hypothetical protein
MNPVTRSHLDSVLAKVCLNCPACRTARKNQAGAAYWLVSRVEGRVCPFCRAYERVFGRKAHEALARPEAPRSQNP